VVFIGIKYFKDQKDLNILSLAVLILKILKFENNFYFINKNFNVIKGNILFA